MQQVAGLGDQQRLAAGEGPGLGVGRLLAQVAAPARGSWPATAPPCSSLVSATGLQLRPQAGPGRGRGCCGRAGRPRPAGPRGGGEQDQAPWAGHGGASGAGDRGFGSGTSTCTSSPTTRAGIAADLDARVVGPGAVGDAEAPGVPGAGDDAALDVAAGQRRAHVRADVVDGVVRRPSTEQGDQLVARRRRSCPRRRRCRRPCRRCWNSAIAGFRAAVA